MVGDDVANSARRFVLASVAFLVAFQLGALLGIGRRPAVVLGLNGFVLHMVFGKAYTLVPSYFARELEVSWPMDVHLVATVGGTAALAAADLLDLAPVVRATGGLAWFVGVAVFVGTIGWAVRDNLAGGETGTGDHNAHRRPIDRAANAFVPLAGAYLLVGSWELAAGAAGLPTVFDGFAPRASHLLAAGAATLLVFAIGFRLLPRFLVADPPAGLVRVVLPAGALGPVLVAGGLPAGPIFHLGAALEAVAVLTFGAAVVVLYRRSDRRRVGFYAVLLGVAGGALGVLLGVSFAVAGRPAGLVTAHYRLNLLGFLGLFIVGIAYQFYPPGAGTFRGASDRTASWSIAGLAGGLAVEVAGLVLGEAAVVAAGRAVGLAGALGYAWLVTGVFGERFG